MRVIVVNHSRIDVADVLRIVADLLHRERKFMQANTVRGCTFLGLGLGLDVALHPVSKDHPLGDMKFVVTDEDTE